MNTLKTLLTIALLGISSLAMAQGSSALDRAHSTMDEFQSSITDNTDQGSSAGSGQVGHSGGVPDRLSGQVDAGNRDRLTKLFLDDQGFGRCNAYGYNISRVPGCEIAKGYPQCPSGYERKDFKKSTGRQRFNTRMTGGWLYYDQWEVNCYPASTATLDLHSRW